MEELKKKLIGKIVRLTDLKEVYFLPNIGVALDSSEIGVFIKLPKEGSTAKVIDIKRSKHNPSTFLAGIIHEDGNKYSIDVEALELVEKVEKPLLIVGTKIIFNTLIFWVKYQSRSVTNFKAGGIKTFTSSEGFKINSRDHPDVYEGAIYIQGNNLDKHQAASFFRVGSFQEAKELEAKILRAVKEFNESEGFQEDLPEIEVKGADPKWKYCVKEDNESEEILFYTKKPYLQEAFWDHEGSELTFADSLDPKQFEKLKDLDWKESLHKIKHV